MLAILSDAEPTHLILKLIGCYLLGAVPFGWLLTRLVKGVDLRTVGSGNIGATNAMRVLGKPLGLFAFFCDAGKGWVPAALIASDDPLQMVLCGGAAVVGHVWPIYLRFKGGKAVATSCGAIFAIDPWIFIGAGVGWILVLLLTRYVGLASVAMGLLFPAMAWWRSGSEPYGAEVIVATSIVALLILYRHRSNISRILAGTENRAKLGFGSEGKDHD